MQCCRDLPPVSCCLHSIVSIVFKLLDIGYSLPEGTNPHNQCREHIKSRKSLKIYAYLHLYSICLNF
jgi:hypothetical protein